MGNFIPAFVSALKGGTIGAGAGATAKTAAFAAKAVKVAAVTKGVAEVAKAAAPKPPLVPIKISQPPTIISAGEQAKKYEGDRQMDLLSTIIAGRERKNKLG